MALDKVLKIYDENGNPVDYDILASDVKFLPDGKDLPTKLTEMEDAIEDAAESGGYTPPAGGIPKTDLAPSVQTSLGLADTALQHSDLSGYATQDDVDDAISGLVNGAPAALDTLKELADALGDNDDAVAALTNQLANKVDKESGKSLMTDAEHTKLAGIAAGAEVNVQADWTQTNTSADDYIKNKPTLATVATSGSYNDLSNKPTIPDTSGFVTTSTMNTALAGKQDTLTFDTTPTANSTNPVTSGGVKTYVDGKASITGITTSQDGTFTIAMSDGNSYTVNLNHTHENMAKLVKCTEATLPQTMADDTIYVQVDNLTTPTVIEALHIFGLEFTGGGGGSTPSLPYDAEIEYLQTTGTQYIDTGIVSGTNIVAEIKAILTQTSSDVQTFLCARTENNISFSNLLSIKNVSTPYTQFGGGASSVDSSADPTVLHTYRTGLQNNSLFFETDGTTEGTRTISGSTSNLSMYLFARHTDSGADRGIYSKLYYCKITKDGSLVRDFIPVRKGTTGYLYDKVSGQLFGNAGSGSFTLGNDKS